MPDEEPKIIIDEGWKQRVEREREEARVAAEKTATEPESDEAGGADESAADPMFLSLVTGLATQAMFALGMLGHEGQQEVMVDTAQAKHIIDTVIMLRDKTKGNLTPEEQGHMAEMLAELQRVYVVRAQQVQEAALRNSGINPHEHK